MSKHQPKTFPKIGLFAKHNSNTVAETFEKLIHFLKNRGHQISIEKLSASLVPNHECTVVSRENLGENQDLVIVVGGDGSFLNAARAAVDYDVPMLGINRGRLGFLADILPSEMNTKLTEILEGSYTKENRSLLDVIIKRNGVEIESNNALNDMVIYSGSLARMIELEVSINHKFVSRQSSDGLITATPTGSTAYALSGGGPILYPTLSAFVLVPMFPHTLSSRPIVVEDKSVIEILVTKNNEIFPKISCDGQWHFDLKPGDTILVQKHPKELALIHPSEYDYFSVLRAKLGWQQQIAG